jgi:hypothetical protein
MFGKFTRKNESDGSLDFTRGNGGLLRVGSEFYEEERENTLEDRNPTTRQDLLEASVAIRSKVSLTKLLRMAMALLEIPVSG